MIRLNVVMCEGFERERGVRAWSCRRHLVSHSVFVESINYLRAVTMRVGQNGRDMVVPRGK